MRLPRGSGEGARRTGHAFLGARRLAVRRQGSFRNTCAVGAVARPARSARMMCAVKRVLITGMSGTGKSSVVAELSARGYKAVDADEQTIRHRLDRSGDRKPNRALHMILVTRKRTHPATIAYIERRIQEGKTRRETNRCLKRYLARSLYRLLEHGASPAT